MKRMALLMVMAMILGPDRPAEAFYRTVGRLEVYLHRAALPDCQFPLTKAETDLEINVQKNGKALGSFLPAIIPLNFPCGDCRMTVAFWVWLVEGSFKRVKGKKMLEFAFVVDAREARMECPTGEGTFGFPMQTGSPFGDKSPFTLPWKDGYILTMPGMAVHFILRVIEK